MSLLVNPNDKFDVKVRYTEKNGKILFYEEGEALPPEAKEESFSFGRVSWADTRNIMSAAVLLDPRTGKPVLNPYLFMDVKVKTMLRGWTLKGDDGKDLPLSGENVDSLHPSLINYLNDKVDKMMEMIPEAPRPPEVPKP